MLLEKIYASNFLGIAKYFNMVSVRPIASINLNLIGCGTITWSLSTYGYYFSPRHDENIVFILIIAIYQKIIRPCNLIYLAFFKFSCNILNFSGKSNQHRYAITIISLFFDRLELKKFILQESYIFMILKISIQVLPVVNEIIKAYF